ncbi:branched-chain amino acid ABC transporter substrate-binding protein [Actinomycetospora sp. NBRC 106378]|uniref:branched-chain amino acid ABC transporter substrate-binding protein n=1 Tax=Actinomycetospora sp. NBRC 106378 TaxID=3032208 RepID=UPI0024A5F4C4|nr:branched-chain amino acid ABC transporter substrate-binding protein [Actinomycetospora sp. NBRC 106378]GLZ52100.1 branched chain amino acid ABC transporter substrate-binding protein [Actinomycetospora sp. NBRC 106378]
MVRRRFAAAGALVAAAALVLSGCANQSGSGPAQTSAAPAPAQPNNAVLPAGDGQGRCAPGTSIAYVGTLAGQNAALGQAIANATELAVNQHNQANAGCQVTLVKADSGGTPDTAVGPTQAVINNQAVLGIVGLPFSGESKAVGPALNAAGLVNITPSATNPGLTQNGWTNFFRGLGNDAVQGPAAAKWMQGKFNPQKICVIKDDSDYGIGLATAVSQALGPQVASCQGDVKTNQKEFSATVGQIQQAAPQAIFYAGYYTEAAPLIQQLRDAGVQTPFVAPDGVKDEQYVVNAAGAANGSFLTCPCVPQEGFTAFTQAYQQAYNTPPQTYSAEAYDAATILLQGIDKGANSRPALLNFVKSYNGQGLTKKFQWQPNGELTDTPVYVYRVDGDKIVTDSPISG